MIYFMWSLINLITLIYLLFFINKRVLKHKTKSFSATIIIIGIILLGSNSSSNKINNHIKITDTYNRNNKLIIKYIKLEDNLIFDINSSIQYSVDGNKHIPIDCHSYITGFSSGFVWELKSIYNLNQTGNLTATGVLKWNLLGINIYSELKNFDISFNGDHVKINS
ncbi:hypothetical protein [Tenacibaculum agarivorans]|uniref:hypothetical protein n=1 Tax=Tenacibaculum agarivorans TaxID=1908389 RepID=UPI00094BBF4C|nr:hypothetical protein [Tenacibaculum agarivorans]